MGRNGPCFSVKANGHSPTNSAVQTALCRVTGSPVLMLLGWNLFSIQTFGHEFIEWIRVAMAVPGFWAMSMTAWCFRSV